MSFLDRVLKHPNLPFATDDEENIYNLKKEFANRTHSRLSGLSGRTVSAETRAKISKTAKMSGRTVSAKMSGRTVSAETHAKMSKSQSIKTLPAEHRPKISQSMTGRTVSAKTCAKMSKSQSIRTLAAKHRAKISQSMILRHKANSIKF